MGRPTVPWVRATFVAFGIFWGTWAVAATNIERNLHLSAGGLGLLLSASIGAGGLAAAASGGLAERWGASRFLSRTLVGWGIVSLASAGVARGSPFVATFVLTMTTAGLVDMAMNAAAAAEVAGDAGRMMRFHALFNTGALIGAAAAGVLLHAGMSWRWAWAAVGVGALVLAARAGRADLPGPTPHHPGTGVTGPAGAASITGSGAPDERAGWLRSLRAIQSQHLVVLAVVFAVTAMVEGGIDTWGVLFLRTHLAAGVLLGAGAYCLGQAIAISTRGGLGGHIGRVGARWGLVIGAGVAAGGLALEAGSAHAAPAAIGLALAAGGISLCWPLVMAVASTVALASVPSASGRAGATVGQESLGDQGDSVSPAALVGALTAAGYVGWVAGPALVGWVADTAGLSTGLFLLSGLAATAAVVLALIPTRPSAVA
jgi:MFS family permease